MEKMRVALVAMVACLLVLEGVHAICNVSNDDLMKCQSAIRMDNPDDKPSDDCCALLRSAKPSTFKCLCQYKDSSMLQYFGINPARAIALPQMCDIPNAPKCGTVHA